ncbi:UPF0020-domain-containing protein [Basidiobolus meristosporus CBS 931.73]|uniref:UPF0020-domain-containing protein n=1 Tax=Basidiobolus meristosporus CBS 931.73 TaxID=1314790 RepID=A0A1Y1X589_9FUNG|nr:UPF0020-domain-containing protein [Basidiobolus meristosporus CBS 931.73]|eukprot:ORX80815.1 UPF0020-domain-containing protein [Basidiobolus meristosporus CBS 931.73]
MSIPEIACIVPKGLETIAVDEVREKLPDLDVDYQEASGFLHLKPASEQRLIKLVPSLFTEILSVESIGLSAGSSELSKEFFVDTTLEKLEVEKVLYDLTHNSEDWCWRETFQYWKTLRYTELHEENVKFRVTFDKNGFKYKNLSSCELAGAIGTSLLNLFPDWTVDLCHYDLEVIANLLPAQTPESPCRLHIAFALPRTSTIESGPLNMRNRTELGRTALRPAIAYCMTRLANISPGQLVIDTCCGVGTIPIEGALSHPYALFLGGDVDEDAIYTRGAANILHTIKRNRVDLCLWSAKKLPFRNGVVDTVVSDLPWGRREGSFQSNCKLYPKMMKEIGRVLKPNTGRVILITGERNLFKRVLDMPWCTPMFELEKQIEVTIGYQVLLYVMRRTSAPPPTSKLVETNSK